MLDLQSNRIGDKGMKDIGTVINTMQVKTKPIISAYFVSITIFT